MPLCRGHLKQKDFFKKAVNSGRISHAYIFSGISGIGKKVFAINMAKALVCLEGSFFTACYCSHCRQIDNGSYPDLHICEGSDLKIENIRSIAEAAGMTPLTGHWKIFILDEAERLSASGQAAAGNALLKTLEEPGDDSVFFLITSKYDAVLPTIRSRCGLIEFAPLSHKDLSDVLRDVMPDKNFSEHVINAAGGSAGKALMINELDIEGVFQTLLKGDFEKFVKQVSALNDTDAFKAVIEAVYISSLKKYKETDRYSYCRLGYYMLDILQRLNYNVNTDLVKNDFVSKTVEVFSERI